MKRRFALYCPDRDLGKGEWLLERHKDGINVYDPKDRLIFWFPHTEAERRFRLPSFWRSVKGIQFTTDKGVLITFEPNKADVRAVRQYLDDALLFGGAERVIGLRNKAFLGLAGGIALAFACAAGAYFVNENMAGQDFRARRTARPFFVGIILGVGLFAWGVAALYRSLRLLRRWKQESEEFSDEH
jgi:hypothetical protein